MIQANSHTTRMSPLFVGLPGFDHSRSQCTGSGIQTACDHGRAGLQSSLLSGLLGYGSYYLCAATQPRHFFDGDTDLLGHLLIPVFVSDIKKMIAISLGVITNELICKSRNDETGRLKKFIG